MQIVVTLSEEDYNLLVNVNDDKLPSMNARRHLHEQLKIGTVLPKGHGRLIDVDTLDRDLENAQVNLESALSEAFDDGLIWASEVASKLPTIIEADKGAIE